MKQLINRKKIWNFLPIFAFVVSLVFASVKDAEAIPAFARKYKTSCVTCHTVYPKLNQFGEAYRINGFQFPNDEEAQIKEEQIKMGADAYKRVWPEAVWPNSISSAVPISARARMGFVVETNEDDATTSQFGQPALQLIAGSTMGEDITFFVGAHLFEDGETGSIDRFYLKLDNMFNSSIPDHLLYMRIGQFIPELVPFASNHRALSNTAYAFNTYAPSQGASFAGGHAHGAGPFGIENFQLGIEFSGIVNSRLRYVVGVVNGNGIGEDNNSDKDFYGRASYKFGGMAYDGTGVEAAGSNEKETSLAIGVFGYQGNGIEGTESFSFNRIGVDFNLYYSDLNIIGGYIFGEDGVEAQGYNLYFVEADYMLYPWMSCILRYEQANPDSHDDGDDHGDSVSRIIPNITALYVANVKFMIESRLDPDDLQFDNLYFGMDFGF